MRGKQEEEFVVPSWAGITPAHAGKTFRRLCVRPEDWDHPRACGENQLAGEKMSRGEGSPPRMRGKQTET